MKDAFLPYGEKAITHFRVLKEYNSNNNLKKINNNNYIDNLKKIDTNNSIDNYSKQDSSYSVVEFILETGRTHQIRVHSSYIGHTLLGDDLYGGKCDLINRQALHSYYLSFIHPETRKTIEFFSNIPNDFKFALEKISKSNR